MNCPKCGKEMRQGWLATSPVWTPDKKNRLVDLERDVLFYDLGASGRKLPTGICEDCRILVSEY